MSFAPGVPDFSSSCYSIWSFQMRKPHCHRAFHCGVYCFVFPMILLYPAPLPLSSMMAADGAGPD